ncbi:RelA/SpoT domain-containing protein [Actinomyces bowdenii]|uniref:RelA/SpoT domain-containing protein n=1 Tax=Actinomyces bowdenii TaxID=131109 RepID=A0A853ERA8_9ACTO|nr:RelA/SpoT domain-containing protein [Actinomyces bowdenii]MBF0698033.1 RelA/SpoT domain-containing protein [Actinomyces bowdenii]NYS70206.1 RelA/SpoT domain-containing protein [Actinomyces bowdenii]
MRQAAQGRTPQPAGESAGSTTVSKSAARKAGTNLRRIARGEGHELDLETVLATIDAYRGGFISPLRAVNDELSALLEEHRIDADVSQRLKRMSTIVEKITQRESGLDLSRMQDIGGCRAVLVTDSVKALYTLCRLVCDHWAGAVKRYSDYVETPRPSGYRAIHVIVEQDGHLVEIQLRTQRMHQWAQIVEGLGDALGENYKQDGSSLVQDCALLLSKMYIGLDGGPRLSPEDEARLTDLLQQIRAMLASTHEEQP